jgi:bifunctional DNase/RNase
LVTTDDGCSVGRVDDDLVLLRITDVRVAVPAGNGVEAGLVVLEEEIPPHRSLRLYVGQAEARAIQVSWSNTVPPRPSTWDLFISTIAQLDGRVDRAIIDDVQEERHYFAQLMVHRAEVDEPLVLTARPSDAIALALRAHNARIYARPHVLDEAGLLADGSHWVRPVPDPDPDLDPGGGDGFNVVEGAARIDGEAVPAGGSAGEEEDEPGFLRRQEDGPAPAAPAPVAAGPAMPDAHQLATLQAASERAAAARAARSFAGGSGSRGGPPD